MGKQEKKSRILCIDDNRKNLQLLKLLLKRQGYSVDLAQDGFEALQKIKQELVNRCVNKDKSAWSEFVPRFHPVVERSVRARLARHNFSHTTEDLKDLTQGIFLDIWEKNKLALVKDEDKITGWLAVVAQNAAIDHIRSQAKFNRQRSVYADEDGGLNDILNILPSETNLSQELVKEDLSETVDKPIEALEPREKLILG